MAGDWMKVEKVTPDKPEIDAIAARLDIDPDAVFGKCFRVWRWFDDHTVDGNAPSVTASLLDRRIGVAGFAEALQAVGWLVVTGEGVTLPRFDRHCGETAKQRGLTAKRASKSKSKSNADGNADGNAKVTQVALPREEKRTEEIKGVNPLKPPARFVPPTLDEVREYCRGRKNGISAESFIAHYTANGWVQGRGKPVKDWKACIVTWEQNRKDGGARGSPNGKPGFNLGPGHLFDPNSETRHEI